MSKHVVGIDLAEKGGDHTSIAVARKIQGYKAEVFIIDEAGTFPDFKWYRNPIKWWKWERMSRSLKKQLKKWKKEGKAWTSFDL